MPPIDYTQTVTFLQTMIHDYWVGSPHPVTSTIRVMDLLGIHNPFTGHDTSRLDQLFRIRYMKQVAMNMNYYTLPPQQQNMVDNIFLGVSPQVYAQTHNIENTPAFQQRYQTLATTFGLHYPVNTSVEPLVNIVSLQSDPNDSVVPSLEDIHR